MESQFIRPKRAERSHFPRPRPISWYNRNSFFSPSDRMPFAWANSHRRHKRWSANVASSSSWDKKQLSQPPNLPCFLSFQSFSVSTRCFCILGGKSILSTKSSIPGNPRVVSEPSNVRMEMNLWYLFIVCSQLLGGAKNEFLYKLPLFFFCPIGALKSNLSSIKKPLFSPHLSKQCQDQDLLHSKCQGGKITYVGMQRVSHFHLREEVKAEKTNWDLQ